MRKALRVWVPVALAGLFIGTGAAAPASGNGKGPDPAAVAGHWTKEARKQALPRDLVFDDRGLAYLRGPGKSLQPYGHEVPARVPPVRALGKPTPSGKPGGSAAGDTKPPEISLMNPSSATIGSAYTFKATVIDPGSGVRSVSFVLQYPDSHTQSYGATQGASDVWSIQFSGFSNGSWKWRVVAKDNGAKGGNTATSDLVPFVVDTTGGGGGGGGGNTVTNAEWTQGEQVQTAVGRIFFEMPANRKHTRWTGYVCSGTAVTDSNTNSASVILTAAHCVYDDVYKAFARNVLFIPNQALTTGSATDLNCSNDPLGCWAPSHGVVDSEWSSRKWPNNIPWDYAYYVVPTTDHHESGYTLGVSDSLELAAGTLRISFTQPKTVPDTGAYTYAFGYSYSEDPKLMYCAEDMGTTGASNWWLSQCGLSGGSSGGSWIQPLSGGSGPVISVNSWGYSGSPGMAGPKLSGTASCLFSAAQGTASPVNGGVIPSDC